MNVYQKLQKVRVELQDKELKKTGRNTYSNFTYYELADFLPMVNVLFNDHGLVSKFDIKPGKHEKAILTVINADEPSEQIKFISPTAEVEIGKKKDGTGGAEPIQNLGGKITYMRRYLLMTALEMVESDLVERIKKETTTEVDEADVKKIKACKDIKELTLLYGKLDKKYKTALIRPLFSEKKAELEIIKEK